MNTSFESLLDAKPAQAPAGLSKQAWQDGVPTSTRKAVLLGAAISAVFLLGFGAWAATAPISGAVIASGVVQASGQNQIVDHLEGGIVSAIHVSEGQAVRKGDVLMTLDATLITAERNRIAAALLLAEAQLVRVAAERDERTEIAFGPELEARARMVESEEILHEQRAEFRNRLERHEAELAVIVQRVNAAKDEIEGLLIQKVSEETKLAVLREELANKQTLLEQGLMSRSQYQAVQRAEADSLGRIGGLTAAIGQKRAAIAEFAEQRTGVEAMRREAAASQINDVRAKAADLREQLRAREEVLTRTEIRASVAGVINELSKNTIGSSVKPGEPVAEILPTSREMQIEVRVPTFDVDAVKIGQKAMLRLSALNARTTPDVLARVTYLSADRLVDQSTRESYFTVRLQIEGELPEGVDAEKIYPGMPVDALIQTGERTFVEYMARPIQDSFAKAFREE